MMLNLDYVFEAFPSVKTKRLVLRRLCLSDAKVLFAILSDEEVARFYDEPAYKEVIQAREQIESWTNGYEARRCIRWGITHRGDDNIIGTCGYYGFHTWHRRASIGYELSRPYWRQGIMTEALNAIIELGFREVGLNPVFFGQALTGEKMPNLTYMLVFKNDDERKAAWKRFGAHPLWQQLRKMEEYSDKAILSGITNLPLVAADYSQV